MDTKTIWLRALCIGFLLTWGSYVAGMAFGWVDLLKISWLEVLCVFTSYMCTYMCVHQTRWNYPIGVVTTFLYSWLFYSQGMYAVAAFNLYLVFSLTYGWFRWGDDTKTRPVTMVRGPWWLGYAAVGLVVYGLLFVVNHLFNVTISNTEIFITVFSGVAQFLLDNKKIENWLFWIVVNVLSIWFFASNGLTLVAFQYVFFLANAFYGAYRWFETVEVKTTDLIYNR